MKKIIAMLVMACAFSVAHAKYDARVNAFIQPFDVSYSAYGDLSKDYLWYTDIDLTDPAGSYCDIWTEMARLRQSFPGYSFSHVNYGGLHQFEFGFAPPQYFATIFSDLNR